jgi:hypothetical protein
MQTNQRGTWGMRKFFHPNSTIPKQINDGYPFHLIRGIDEFLSQEIITQLNVKIVIKQVFRYV